MGRFSEARGTVPFSLIAVMSATDQVLWRQPDSRILRLLNTPQAPAVSISPDRRWLITSERLGYPSLAELSAPVLKLAGLRLNPATCGPQLAPLLYSLQIQDLSKDTQQQVSLPESARIGFVGWSPDSRRFAFTMTLPRSIELWVLNINSGQALPIPGIQLSSVLGVPAQWMPDSRTLLVQTPAYPEQQLPLPPTFPTGPMTEECSGTSGPVRTFQDLLKSQHDERLFEHFATSQAELVQFDGSDRRPVGTPAIYTDLDPSPDGTLILTTRLCRPWSWSLPWSRFPSVVEIRRLDGTRVFTLAERPLEDNIPIEGVRTGPRNAGWKPDFHSTLIWLEALDGGNPSTTASHRDRILQLQFNSDKPPEELIRMEHRCTGIWWNTHCSWALVREYDREHRWTRTWRLSPNQTDNRTELLWSRSVNDRYGDPGSPIMAPLPDGRRVIHEVEDCLFLQGAGATPEGDRPFLNRYSLTTGQTTPLFRCSDDSFESVVVMLDEQGRQLLVHHESPESPPNLEIRADHQPTRRITRRVDPEPLLRRIQRRIISCTRSDGVELSFTLCLPADHHAADPPLPALLWAYPREFNDAGTAGQISGSVTRFNALYGASHLFLAALGYAVLDNVSMPIIGSPAIANDTFINQISDSAATVIAKAAQTGAIDPRRVAVGGHSYGAFMAAALLAHTNLFRAGIARSGAYNRTLTPFGFQNERRTFWEAPETYLRLSPFAAADRIRSPLLLIHGEADNNPGTHSQQSERLYQAIRGTGGIARLVMLPLESHSCIARESIEHTLWEMQDWLRRWLQSTES